MQKRSVLVMAVALIALALAFVAPVHADLPIHCLHAQVRHTTMRRTRRRWTQPL